MHENGIIVAPKQAEEITGLSELTLRRLAHRGVLTPLRFGRRVRYRVEELNALFRPEPNSRGGGAA